MGLDLKLLPVYTEHEEVLAKVCFSHNVLSCERRRSLFEEISKVCSEKGEPVPEKFNTFSSKDTEGESCYGNTQIDSYGERVKFLRAKDLLKWKDHEGVKDNFGNRAIWAFLAECPPQNLKWLCFGTRRKEWSTQPATPSRSLATA